MLYKSHKVSKEKTLEEPFSTTFLQPLNALQFIHCLISQIETENVYNLRT